MRISKNTLGRFVSIDGENGQSLRELLDSVGIEVKRLFSEEDDIFYDLELLANRGDHRCYEGIAREIHGRTGGGVATIDPTPRVCLVERGPSVRVETPLCYRYELAEYRITAEAPVLPPELLKILAAGGDRSVFPLVDAANIVQWEMGQPLHVFDADSVVGDVVVREARSGEACHPLFSESPVGLPRGAIVICDDLNILAVAGVIGCKPAEVTSGTRRAFVESACFDPVAIRTTSRAIRTSTSASQRFERGSDPKACTVALERLNQILESLQMARVVGFTSVSSSSKRFEAHIDFNLERLRAFLGWSLSDREVTESLTRLGYQVKAGESWRVDIPSWRIWDVNEAADVFEDVLRCASYEKAPESAPPVAQGSMPSQRESDLFSIRESLVGSGFFEVFTDAFYGSSTRSTLLTSQEHPLWAHVETVNAVDRHYSLLKNNCIAQALQAVSENARFGEHTMRLFEVCKTFHPSIGTNAVPEESSRLWGVVTGSVDAEGWRSSERDFDFWDVKGVLRNLAIKLRRDLRVDVASAPAGPVAEFLHPVRRAALCQGHRQIGIAGEVSPTVVERFDITRKRVLYFELELQPLLDGPTMQLRPRIPPVRPPSRRTISFVLPAGVLAARVATSIHELSPGWVTDVRVSDSFDLPSMSPGTRSVTFEILIDNVKSDRTAKEINALLEALAADVPERLRGDGVTLRQ